MDIEKRVEDALKDTEMLPEQEAIAWLEQQNKEFLANVITEKYEAYLEVKEC